MTEPRVTAVVADDHPVFVDGLVTVLADHGVRVVATAADGAEALAAVAAHRPDVVLMDLSMPGMSGLEATRRVVAEQPATAVVVLTMSDDDESVFAALRAGARGYLLKGATADDIVRAVSAAARGEAILGAQVSQRVLGVLAARQRGGSAGPFPQLTEREREVLDLIARGRDNARIARALGLSEKTVRNHVSMVLTKLPAATRAEAVALARDAGLGQGV
ncbi:MAG: response regulator transcription factor [Actinomycetota bacterium]|nr:response regulator transcription factor [Actinomycetota bacterium]